MKMSDELAALLTVSAIAFLMLIVILRPLT
jgi:hypothetical protein